MMRRDGVLAVVMIAVLFLTTSLAYAGEFRGTVSNGIKFNQEVQLNLEKEKARVSIGPHSAEVTVDNPREFFCNPTGRAGADMKLTQLPDGNYRVVFVISGLTGGTSGPSFAEGILYPVKK